MWYGYHGGPWCFGFLFFFLVFAFFIFRGFMFRRRGFYSHHGWSDEAENILRKRLASGEITEEEYQKLKDALKK